MQLQINQNKSIWLYVLTGIFIALNAIAIYFEFFYLGMICIFIGLLFIALSRLDVLVYLIVLLTPLSIPLRELAGGALENDISLPTEPLILLLLLVFILKLIKERKFDIKILKHPISMAIAINLIWIFLTSVTSTMPLVSFKFLASRLWFLVAYYLLLSQIFHKQENINRFLWLYSLPMLIVIFYSVYRQWIYGITDKHVANFVPSPFFNDHTAYGAALAMIFPAIIYFFFQKNKTLLYRTLVFIFLAINLAAIILSYTRATWLSMIAAFVVYLIIRFKIRFRFLLLSSLIILGIIIASWQQIMMKLEKNKTESSDYFIEHVESMTNVSSDASNLERLNRWSCAFKMFREKPVLGWGPGTYKFKYAPFQMSYQKTIISTNAGTLGNAHSEYIGPLSEMGILGTLTLLAIIILTLIHGIRLYHKLTDQKLKGLVMAMIIGLVTYYIHGLINNFLDTDKASCLFWGYTAVIVSIEVYHNKNSITKTN